MRLILDNIKKVIISPIEQEPDARHLALEIIDSNGERHLVICHGEEMEREVKE
jgi:hypothetical protein